MTDNKTAPTPPAAAAGHVAALERMLARAKVLASSIVAPNSAGPDANALEHALASLRSAPRDVEAMRATFEAAAQEAEFIAAICERNSDAKGRDVHELGTAATCRTVAARIRLLAQSLPAPLPSCDVEAIRAKCIAACEAVEACYIGDDYDGLHDDLRADAARSCRHSIAALSLPTPGAGGWQPLDPGLTVWPWEAGLLLLWHPLWERGVTAGYYDQATDQWRGLNEDGWFAVGIPPSHYAEYPAAPPAPEATP